MSLGMTIFWSWILGLLLGVLFCWLLKGWKATSFTLGFAIVGLGWVIWYLLPVGDSFL